MFHLLDIFSNIIITNQINFIGNRLSDGHIVCLQNSARAHCVIADTMKEGIVGSLTEAKMSTLWGHGVLGISL